MTLVKMPSNPTHRVIYCHQLINARFVENRQLATSTTEEFLVILVAHSFGGQSKIKQREPTFAGGQNSARSTNKPGKTVNIAGIKSAWELA